MVKHGTLEDYKLPKLLLWRQKMPITLQEELKLAVKQNIGDLYFLLRSEFQKQINLNNTFK